MQVRYGTGDAAQWLTGTPYNEDAGPIVVSGRAAVQVADLVRGTTPYIAGLGNKAFNLPIPVILQFADWMEALRYTHENFWDLPDDGQLLLREQWGTDLLEISYPNAALSNITTSRRGSITVQTLFTFVVAGPPTITPTSDAPLRIATEAGDAITTES